MTTITYKPYCLEIQGHAGYAIAGQDIVCAGISTLFFTLIEVLARDADLKERPHVRMGDGEAEVTVTPDPKHRDKTDAVFETVVTGLRMMAEKYPEHVVFKMNPEEVTI